jgi:hypothetical protein
MKGTREGKKLHLKTRLCSASDVYVAALTFFFQIPHHSFLPFSLTHRSSFCAVRDAYYGIPRGSPVPKVLKSRGVYRTGYEN